MIRIVVEQHVPSRPEPLLFVAKTRGERPHPILAAMIGWIAVLCFACVVMPLCEACCPGGKETP